MASRISLLIAVSAFIRMPFSTSAERVTSISIVAMSAASSSEISSSSFFLPFLPLGSSLASPFFSTSFLASSLAMVRSCLSAHALWFGGGGVRAKWLANRDSRASPGGIKLRLFRYASYDTSSVARDV